MYSCHRCTFDTKTEFSISFCHLKCGLLFIKGNDIKGIDVLAILAHFKVKVVAVK